MSNQRSERLIVCCTPFGEDWTWFVQELTNPSVRWRFFSDLPRSPWQKLFTRPNLLTLFAGLRTALAARRHHADLIITIGPRYAFWVGFFGRLLRNNAPQMVFSFNYPELPARWKTPLLRFAFKHLDSIRVHSTMEIELYHRLFAIPTDRIHLALWAMNTPPVEPAEPLMPGPYLASIGGNSRDYTALLAAARLAPEIPMAWVVRPENLTGLDIPPHIKTFCNIPYPEAMNYLAHSRALVLTLLGCDVPCGHVTLVSAMFLAKAILVTDSVGISDYITNGVNGLLHRAHDPQDIANGMRQLWNDPAATDNMGRAGLAFAQTHCTEAIVRQEMQAYLAQQGLTPPVSA